VIFRILGVWLNRWVCAVLSPIAVIQDKSSGGIDRDDRTRSEELVD
jgi:hypothetical protein